ncbi:hypothetical protein RA307_31770 [Xanthobacteraceae bacterium Astr-EGSB]|uniref:hypothetical protein n=1 Tax=Astrobacterium formosum TaxID=3069710 RepID=UPI0027B32668|nr:hypothetical protein [Xanthobacteraceae bacterium Astr-EGSB]
MTTPRDQSNRIDGALVPIADVELHLACGWQLVADEQPIDERLFLAAPQARQEEMAA